MRSYLAPLGIAVAEPLHSTWVTLDLDEDDAEVAKALGHEQDSAAYGRLVGIFAPLFDGLSAASPAEAEAISRRHGLAVEHVPNAMELTEPLRRADGVKDARQVSLLFVGNLTYQPNIEAATVLVRDILPAVRRRLGDQVAVTLVGSHGSELNRLAGPGVELKGFVPDLAAVYEGADVAVVPLRRGGGTRIKLLEAFAHRVPVVASTVAAAGLEASDERHLLLADDPDEAAAAIEKLISKPSFAARLSAEAWLLVRDRYSTDVVLPRVRQFFARAAAHGAARTQLSALL
jgi:glycosyltransferase involved in cell wall biosynthesis